MANDSESLGSLGIDLAVNLDALQEELTAAVGQAQAGAAQIASALSIAVPAPDLSPVTDAFQRVSDAASSAGQSVANSMDVQVVAPDTSAVTDSLAALSDASAASAQALASSFSGAAIEAPDTSQVTAALASVDDAAKTTADQVSQDFAGMTVAPLDFSAIFGEFEDVKGRSEQLIAAVNDALGRIDTEGFVSAFHAFSDNAGLSAEAADNLQQHITEMWSSGAAGDMGQALAQSLKEIGDNAQASVAGVDALAAAERDAGDAATQAAAGQKTLSDGAQSVVDAQKKADDELRQAQGILAEMRAAYEQGAVGAEALARAAQDVSSAFQQANPSIQQAQQAASGASESFGSMNQALGLIGVSLSVGGFVALAKDVAEVTDSLTRANIALTNITGSAQQAADMLEKIDQLGLSDGLSIPGLQQAAISMANLLPAGTDVVGTLSLIANGAELMGTSIDAASKKFDLIAESGKASDKALSSLGLNMDKLKTAMEETGANLGAFGDDAKKAFAALDAHDRIVVLQTALQDLGDTAKQVADETFSGAWHKATAQFDVDVALIIKDLGSVSDKTSGFGDALKGTVNVIGSAFVVAYTIVKGAVDGIIDLLTAAFQATVAAQLALDSAVSGQFSKGWQQLKDGMSSATALVKQSWADVTADVSAGAKTINDLMNQTSAAVKPVIDGFDGMGEHAKDAADKVAEAAAAVAKFGQQVDAGGSVAQLQKDFENASKAIDTLAKSDLPAAIKAVDDYTAAQLRNGASGAVIMEAFEKESALIKKLANEDLPAASAAELKLIDTLGQGNAPLGIWNKALADEEAILQKLAKEDLAAAEAGWDRLIRKLEDTHAPLSVLNQALQDHTKFLDAVSKAADNAVTSQIKLAEQFSKVALNVPSANKAITDMESVLKLIGPDLDLVVQKADPFNRAMIDAGVNVGKAKTAFQDLATPIEKITSDLDEAASKARDTGDWSNYEKVIESVDQRFQNLSKVSLPQAVSELEAVVQEMIKAGAPADLIQQEMGKLGTAVQKMASEQLPGAQAAWDKYIALLRQVPSAIQDIENAQDQQLQKDKEILAGMQARGDAYGYILDQQAKVLQEDIHIAEQSGADANAQVMALEGVRLKLQELKLESHGYADEVVAGINDMLKGFDSLASAMSDAIINGKNLGDALVGSFKKIGESLLTDVLKAGMLPLKLAISDVIQSLLPNLDLGLKVTQASAKALTDAMATQASVIDGVVNADIAATAAKTANTGATAADTGATIADTGATVADTGATIADTGATIADTGATIADTAATIADTAATIADTTAEIAETAATIAATVAQIAFASTVTAVAAIVGAIAGIVGDVYLAAIDTKLFHVETSLLEIRNTVENSEKDSWDQFGQMYGRLGEVMNDTHSMRDTLLQIKAAGVAGGMPDQALTDLNDIAAMARVVFSGWPTMQGALQTIAGDIVTWGGYIESDTAVMVQKLGQILTAILSGTSALDGVASAANVAAAADDVTAAVDSAGGDVGSAVAQASDDITASVDDVGGAVTDGADSITDAVVTAGSDIVAAGDLHANAISTTVTDIGDRQASISDAMLQKQIDEANSREAAATTEQAQLDALRSEYGIYQQLIANAIAEGDLKRARDLQASSDNLLAQIRQMQGDIQGIPSLIDQQIVASTGTLGYQVTGAGTLIQTAVNDNGQAIAQAQAAVAAAVKNLQAVEQSGNGDAILVAQQTLKAAQDHLTAVEQAGTKTSTAIGAAGNQVTTAVNNAATTISTAVAAAVAQAAFKPTGPGTTTSTTAAPPYAGPNPAAGSTPAPAGGGGFGGGTQKNDTNSPANIPTTIVSGTYNQYDPTIPDPTKPKPPAAPVLDTTSPYSSYTPPAPAATVPAPKPQPVGTAGTPLPTGAEAPPASPATEALAVTAAKIASDQESLAVLTKQLATATAEQKPALEAQAVAMRNLIEVEQQALAASAAQSAASAQLAADQAALRDVLKQMGNSPDDSSLKQKAADLSKQVSDDQTLVGVIQQDLAHAMAAVTTASAAVANAAQKAPAAPSGTSTSSPATSTSAPASSTGRTLVYTDPSNPLAVTISGGSPSSTTPTNPAPAPAPTAPSSGTAVPTSPIIGGNFPGVGQAGEGGTTPGKTADLPTLKGGPVHGPTVDIPLAVPPTAIPTSPIIGGNFPGVGQPGEGKIPTSPVIGGNFPGVGQTGEGGETPAKTAAVPTSAVIGGNFPGVGDVKNTIPTSAIIGGNFPGVGIPASPGGTSAAPPASPISPEMQQLLAKSLALQQLVADDQQKLIDAQKTGNATAIQDAKKALDVANAQWLTLQDQVAALKSGVPVLKPIGPATGGAEPAPGATSTGAPSAGAPATPADTLDPRTLGFYASTGAELEDIRNVLHLQAQLTSSTRDAWVAFQATQATFDKAFLGQFQAFGQALLDSMSAKGGANVPSFDEGGMVPFDMKALVHQGELIVPRIETPGVIAALSRTAQVPGSPGGGSASGGGSAPATAAGGGGGGDTYVDHISIQIDGSRDPETTARAVHEAIKKYTRGGGFGQ